MTAEGETLKLIQAEKIRARESGIHSMWEGKKGGESQEAASLCFGGSISYS